ncbi:MAG: ExbD/TolR family protein [Candidatus Brocadiia bacterium]
MRRLTEELEDRDDRADLTPLVDCVFLLLLFFIVTAAFVEETLFKVELPKAQQAEVRDRGDVVVLAISRAGQFAIGQRYVPQDRLWEELRDLHESQPITTLVIKGDRQCPYEKVVMAMDIAQELDIPDFSLVVDRPERAAP